MKNLNSIFFALIAFFSFTFATSATAGNCNNNFYYKTVKHGDKYGVGKDVYVKVNAQKYQDIEYMELYINNRKIRRETSFPYEWAKPNGSGDNYLRNMKPGTYQLKCVVKTRCGGMYHKKITFYVKQQQNNFCNTNYRYLYAKHGSKYQRGKNVYVKIGAEKHRDVEYMELYINGHKVRRETSAPYEWGKPNGGGDHYLRNMKPGTYHLKCKIKTRCGEIIWKKSTIYVK